MPDLAALYRFRFRERAAAKNGYLEDVVCGRVAGTAWSTKCYMNMRPLYQPQLMQTEAFA